jgi:hypothetical protein
MSAGPIQTGIRWTGWWSQLETYLGAKIGYAGCPLLYVVRPAVNPENWEPANDFERQIQETRHEGPDYESDNRVVYGEIKSFCKDTDAWVWIREFERAHNGRGAALALQSHYEGDGEKNKRRIWGAKQLEEAHYKSEHIYSFEKFSTKMKDAYKTLNDHGENHSESEMVRILLERMQVANNGAVDAVKRICSRDFPADFTGAVNYLSGEITSIFPSAGAENPNRRRRLVSEARQGDRGGRGRGGRFQRGGGRGRFERGGRPQGRGRFQGRGGRGGGGGGGRTDPATPYTSFHGVDIRDIWASFPSNQWDQLQQDGRSYVMRLRKDATNASGGSSSDARQIQQMQIQINELRSQAGTDAQSAITEETEQERPRPPRGGRGGARMGAGRYGGGRS